LIALLWAVTHRDLLLGAPLAAASALRISLD